jgi:hypothetical protein
MGIMEMKKDWELTEEEKVIIKTKIKEVVPEIEEEAVELACKEITEDIEYYAGALFYHPGCLDKIDVGFTEGYIDESDGYEFDDEFWVHFNGRTLYFAMDGHNTGS